MPVYDFSGAFANLNSGIGDIGTALEKARQEAYAQQAADLLAKQLTPAVPAAPSTFAAMTAPAAPAAPAAPSFAGGGRARVMANPPDPALASEIVKQATAAGYDPHDLATAMSYETGGTFTTDRTPNGRLGLIQFGPAEARAYGAVPGQSAGEQVAASIRYLQDRGLKPGMGMMDLYSTINAGRPGLYDRSDAANGGAPGTVADKVNTQMAGHREAAQRLLAPVLANVPAAGAAPTAGFAIPQARAPKTASNAEDFVPGTDVLPAQAPTYPAAPSGIPATGAPAAKTGLDILTPQQRTMLQQELANPVTRAGAIAKIQKLSLPEEFETKEVGGQLYRIGKTTGQAQIVPGVAKPQDWNQFKGADGNDYLFNKQSGQLKRAVEGGQYEDVTDPKELARIRPAGYAGPVQRGPDNKLEFPGAGAQGINVENAGQVEAQKIRFKRFDDWITEGTSAQKAQVDIESLRDLGRNIGPAGVAAPIKDKLGPFAQAVGVDISGLSDIQAYQSIIKRLTPNMRPPGSGATSNYEERLYQAALPGLLMHPTAREMVLDTMQAGNDHAIARAKIGQDVIDGVITQADAAKQIRALPDPLERFREFRKTNPTIVRDAAQGKTASAAPTTLPKDYTPERALAEAKNAIAKGKPRDAVVERLRALGVDPAGL